VEERTKRAEDGNGRTRERMRKNKEEERDKESGREERKGLFMHAHNDLCIVVNPHMFAFPPARVS